MRAVAKAVWTVAQMVLKMAASWAADWAANSADAKDSSLVEQTVAC